MGQQPTRFRQTILDLSHSSEVIRQNRLIDKVQMFTFLCDRGLADWSVRERFEAITKELFADMPGPDGAGEFHPFRFYTVFRALENSANTVGDSSADGEIIDLAVLLEPIYWPDITYRRTTNVGEDEYSRLLDEYKGYLLPLL